MRRATRRTYQRAEKQAFLSTLSLRRATIVNRNCNLTQKFLSTLSLRRATDQGASTQQGEQISIHALLAESDGTGHTSQQPAVYFYPRSPCGERLSTLIIGFLERVFLSTLSLRRATRGKVTGGYDRNDFYPRSPCGERRNARPETRQRDAISIHALLAESDRIVKGFCSSDIKFLSTLSLRRATNELLEQSASYSISIHALLAESDYDTSSLLQCQVKFLSTLSLRRATTALAVLLMSSLYFYPRSPCGERRNAVF